MSRFTRYFVVLFSAWVGLAGCTATSSPAATAYPSFVDSLELSELAESFDPAQVESVLDGQMTAALPEDRRSAATLIVAGLIESRDLASEGAAVRKLSAFRAVESRQHSAMFGKVGDATLFRELGMPLNYEALLAADDVLEVLGDALAEGVITGYDLRSAGVYDGFPPGESFVYSHSDPVHLRQLTALLAREGIDAWVHVTPKVSAFLHRAEWGTPGSNVATLANGARVVQGQEMAVLFQFGSADDRGRFHDVVTRYAKRDSDDEQGLIAGAWWQPFYYTDREFSGFRPISLVVLTAGGHEATLTVLPDRAQSVIDAVDDSGWQIRHDQVWVNPAFYRFLEGGYK
ncbi:MAG: hypothetical protein NXH85_03255 [Pseudomonadaceae bacterium]|nr:hypothetical protein [Pseudomonadaceae bacterium]